MDGNMTAMFAYIKGNLAKDLRLVTKMAELSSAVAKKAKLGVDNLNLAISQNTVVGLTANVGALEGQILYLQNLVMESGDLMIGIVNGKIPIIYLASGLDAGTTGGVTGAEFNGHKLEQERELALLKHEICGEGYTIGSLLFTALEESTSYCNLYFPPKSYDCIVGLVGLMGPVTDSGQ